MLKLICDRCKLEVELIHHMEPKSRAIDGDEPDRFWEIPYEQSGIGYGENKYFDNNPQEYEKWNWNNGMGTADEWYLDAHLCHNCKGEYSEYIKNYKDRELELDEISDTDFLKGKATMKIKHFKELLQKDKEKYKKDFLNRP